MRFDHCCEGGMQCYVVLVTVSWRNFIRRRFMEMSTQANTKGPVQSKKTLEFSSSWHSKCWNHLINTELAAGKERWRAGTECTVSASVCSYSCSALSDNLVPREDRDVGKALVLLTSLSPWSKHLLSQSGSLRNQFPHLCLYPWGTYFSLSVCLPRGISSSASCSLHIHVLLNENSSAFLPRTPESSWHLRLLF